MNMQKLKWIVLAALIGVAVLVWGVIHYIANRAEARLLATLTEYGLQYKLYWQESSTSFGSVTLNGVHLALTQQSGLRADRVVVSDLNDNRDHQSVHVQIEGLSVDGTSRRVFLPDALYGQATGRAHLPPLDADITVDVRYDKDEAQLALVIKQKDGLDVDASMQLTRIAALRTLINAPEAQRAMRIDWNALHIKQLAVRLKDRGAVKRGVALYKRYNTALDPEAGSVKLQQDKQFSEKMQVAQADCQKERVVLATKNVEETCRAIMQFLSGDSDTLQVSASPRVSMPLMRGLAAYFPVLGFFSRGEPLSPQVLNVEVTS